MRRLRALASGDHGAIAAMVPALAFMILLLGGLVIDASRQLNARGRAVAYAEEAARSGAGAIQLDQPGLVLDRAAAMLRVQQYCDQVTATDPTTTCEAIGIEAVSATDPRLIVVAVRAETTIPTTLLGMVGVQELHASGEGRARPIEGVDANDAD